MNRLMILGSLLALMAGGCLGPTMPPASPQWRHLAELSYPVDAPLGEDLDIIVVRHGGTIELANRTANSYRDVQLWLNEQWVGSIDQVAIGTDNRFTLNRFVDRHGRSFPIAGILTPDKTRPLVLAEIYNPDTGERHRLTVQLERAL